MKKNLTVGILAVTFLIGSCRNPLGDENEIIGVPDTVSENVRQVTISPSGRMEITAGLVEGYKKLELSSFQNVWMRKYNETGELDFEGKADSASFRKNGDGDVNGTIRIRDYVEDVGITAETLVWKQESRMLTSDGTVTILENDFTITGTGFSADIAQRDYNFKEKITGRFNDTEEDKNADKTDEEKRTEETSEVDETGEISETEQQDEP